MVHISGVTCVRVFGGELSHENLSSVIKRNTDGFTQLSMCHIYRCFGPGLDFVSSEITCVQFRIDIWLLKSN